MLILIVIGTVKVIAMLETTSSITATSKVLVPIRKNAILVDFIDKLKRAIKVVLLVNI